MAGASAIAKLQWFGDALSDKPGLRSKALKVVQYSAKLYVWANVNGLVREQDPKTAVAPNLKSLAKVLGTSRKVMNLGDCISDFFSMREAIRSAWAEPGNPDRVREAVAAVTDFVCDLTTDLQLLASMSNSPDSLPDWVERANDITWGLGASLSVISASGKLSDCVEARAKLEAAAAASEAAGAAAERRHRRSADEDRSAVSPLHRRAVAALAEDDEAHAHGGRRRRPPSGKSLEAARTSELWARVALARAVCELIQSGPGVFGIDTPSELLYLMCGLTNGALGVWAACAQ